MCLRTEHPKVASDLLPAHIRSYIAKEFEEPLDTYLSNFEKAVSDLRENPRFKTLHDCCSSMREASAALHTAFLFETTINFTNQLKRFLDAGHSCTQPDTLGESVIARAIKTAEQSNTAEGKLAKHYGTNIALRLELAEKLLDESHLGHIKVLEKLMQDSLGEAPALNISVRFDEYRMHLRLRSCAWLCHQLSLAWFELNRELNGLKPSDDEYAHLSLDSHKTIARRVREIFGLSENNAENHLLDCFNAYEQQVLERLEDYKDTGTASEVHQFLEELTDSTRTCLGSAATLCDTLYREVTNRRVIRVVLSQEEGYWVARSLDYLSVGLAPISEEFGKAQDAIDDLLLEIDAQKDELLSPAYPCEVYHTPESFQRLSKCPLLPIHPSAYKYGYDVRYDANSSSDEEGLMTLEPTETDNCIAYIRKVLADNGINSLSILVSEHEHQSSPKAPFIACHVLEFDHMIEVQGNLGDAIAELATSLADEFEEVKMSLGYLLNLGNRVPGSLKTEFEKAHSKQFSCPGWNGSETKFIFRTNINRLSIDEHHIALDSFAINLQ